MNFEIGLSQMQGRPLQEVLRTQDSLLGQRKEYKFVVPVQKIPQILQDLSEEFDYSFTENGPLRPYKTIYFDTPELKSFHSHRQGKFNRLKWRIREYEDKQFLECKRKVKGKFTQKKREEVEFALFPEGYQKQVEVQYKRLFLSSKNKERRITIDLEVRAECEESGRQIQLVPGQAILEIKSQKIPSDLMRLLRRKYALRPSSFSKYCVAICHLRNMKANKWKAWLKTPNE